MYSIKIGNIDLNTDERLKVESFLSTFNLLLDKDVEHTIVARYGDEIIGTCSSAGKILKCFAVSEKFREQGIASKLITYLTDQLFDKGIYETFIFTEPKNLSLFKELNYSEVERVEEVALLEGGMSNVNRYVEKMFKDSGLDKRKRAALVMNCNPFTLGHRYLIERASIENDEVVVFIVEEDRSLFPFEVRKKLVKAGTEDLNNVHVLSGGSYIISSATFPSYFLRQEDIKMDAYAKLDAEIFGKYIRPAFNIEKRYVGTEPYCSITNGYNEALINILPKHGIEVVEVNRLNSENIPISASYVRRLIKTEDYYILKNLVPKVTYDYLMSTQARPIIEKAKRSETPH
ncbi:[citrate (pro-3S)-lyase] ligase [Proteiniborus ethanoligenes]|uniref:[Citrate [pro-3S]-lyase] ligase n=1 Tax=Proteiniborus ethanoligenes TaxID=415015 RepID=A0A1H3LC52_9FIRM|nr:[citrate (pro-3S)-lyase] ligase [Proteiniborus ethanoligenes]SDY61876.1 [citrate (pro-3S)-lyase] ligase [Proteiniborus ethanoligenes]